MAVVPFGEWRPDLTDFQAETSRLIVNVAPRADGYGPLKSHQPYTQALPAPCRGSFLAVTEDDIVLFAGTLDRLYRMNNGTLGWEDVSQGGAAYTALDADDNWTFAQFNRQVVACQRNEPPQVILTTGATFADLAGNPPQAAYCSIVQSQLVLSGLLDEPQRVQWSAKDNIEEWTLAVNGADQQDFPDGGRVLGVAGGEFGVVFQDAAIRRMTYLPGDERIFQFDRIAEGEGLRAPYSVVNAGSRIFYLGTSGFQMIMGGAPPVNISKERFNRFFERDWDSAEMGLMQGANEPNSSRVWFFYKSVNGVTGLFNRAILYDWVLERPTYIDGIMGEHAGMMAQPGVTLDTLPDIGFDNIDTMEISFDAFQRLAGAILGVFGADHRLGFLTGPNMVATMSSPEQAFDDRYFVSQVRPCTDSPDTTSVVTHRGRIEDLPVTSAPSSLNRAGFCPHRIDTRMARFTQIVPLGAIWTFHVGVEPLLVKTGKV
jgi:hypothetical protein